MPEKTNEVQTYNQINRLINSSRFYEAFLMLKNRMLSFPGLIRERNQLQTAETTYRYLIDFLSSGHEDPSRKEVIEEIRDSLYHANDLLLRETRLLDSSDVYSFTRRMENLHNNSLASYIENFKKSFKEDNEGEGSLFSRNQWQALDNLFNYVWTMAGSDQKDYEQLSLALSNAELPYYLKLSLISALILGGITYFDPQGFEILLTQYETGENPAIQARAITGVLLLSLLHSSRLKGNLNLRSRLMLTIDSPDLKKILKEVLISIVKTYDTQRIDSKMRNEVIPGLMKLKPEILDRMRNLTSDADNFLNEDTNPNWEEILENSEAGDKLREMNELQLEGADVMVTAFSNLKSFPFFNQVSNWFLPFIPENYEFIDLPIDKDSETVSRLTSVMCDSDLHSFLLSIRNLPESNRNQLINNLSAQMKEAKEAMSNAVGETEADILSKEIKQALQDLYRFFKFFKKKSDFNDPFASPFLSSHLQPLIESLGITPEDILLVGEFYFQKKYYEEAAGMFELYETLQPGDSRIWEKIGYCYDRLQSYDKAIVWYKKAELINPDNNWLLKRLAVSLKNSGKSKDALPYYKVALENDPENYHLLMSAAQCLIDINDFEEALKHLYHAQYIKPEKIDVKRALAWTELLEGNKEKALMIYDSIVRETEANASDYLNAAHAELANGNFKEALPLYKKFIEHSESGDIKALVLALRDDSETLKRLNIKTSDLRILVDKIRYDGVM